jgi:hypothetical protein
MTSAGTGGARRAAAGAAAIGENRRQGRAEGLCLHSAPKRVLLGPKIVILPKTK